MPKEELVSIRCDGGMKTNPAAVISGSRQTKLFEMSFMTLAVKNNDRTVPTPAIAHTIKNIVDSQLLVPCSEPEIVLNELSQPPEQYNK